MAAQKHIHENWLALFAETTPCVAPGNWAADATWIEHLSCDTSGLKQTLTKDPTLEGRSFAVGTRQARKGVRNCTMSYGVKLHGTGATTADTVQVAQMYLGTILEHCMGGVHRGTRHTVVTGTTTEVELAAVTGVSVGCILWFQDTTSPTAQNTGKLHMRRVIEIDTATVTLSEALPFTPAAGDIAHPAITPYLASSALVDAFATPSTLQYFVRKAKTGTELLWTVEGSVASMKVDGLGKGALPSISLDVMACNFRHGGGDGLTNPSPTVFKGSAQLSMGRDVVCNIAAYGSSTLTTLNATNVTFDPGFQRARVESTTEVIDRTDGTATYSFTPGDTKFSVTVSGYDSAWYAGLEAGTEWRISFYQPGDGSGAGKAWGIHIARAQLIETPARADLNENHAVTLNFQAMEAEDCVGGSNEDLERTRFTIALG